MDTGVRPLPTVLQGRHRVVTSRAQKAGVILG
jgi:hypothetical protein